MGLMQKACETYDAMAEQYAGQYRSELREPLAPIGHTIKKAAIEITIDADGRFVQAVEVALDDQKTVIPSTEDAESRSGKKAFTIPYPLCEQLKFLIADENYYLPVLKAWADSEHSHPTVNAVLNYMRKGEILKDLSYAGLIKADEKGAVLNGDDMIRWRVLNGDTSECRKDKSLFLAYQNYSHSQLNSERSVCMMTGECLPVTRKHPKGVIAFNGNAKLISANDSSGFTYRGRFIDDRDAVSVSYEASQKAHNALRWLVANQGNAYGGRTFLCWNPKGVSVPTPQASIFRRTGKARYTASDYRSALNSEIMGFREKLPRDAEIVLAAFDAATTGRLALTYYSELHAADYFERFQAWEDSCCWQNGQFGIQSPSLLTIVECAFGTQRTEKDGTKFVVDDRLLAQQMQRLVAAKIDSGRMPRDIVTTLVNRASMPQAYDISLWRKLLFVSCAAVQKYYEPIKKGELIMEWDLSNPDRSFQFGRLLAVMDRAENDYYRNSDEDRMTNAVKAMAQFRQTPWTVFERINRMLETAYLPRSEAWARKRYYRLREEIVSILSNFGSNELNKPLGEFYLMGYSLQRNAFYAHNEKTEELTETEE